MLSTALLATKSFCWKHSLLNPCSNHMELVKAEHTDRESAPMKFGKALQIAQLVRVCCSAVLRCAAICCAALCGAALRCYVMCCAVLCCALLCSAVLRCAFPPAACLFCGAS